VTLTGAVDTSTARERAVQIARSTEGVNNVIDNLTVSPGATPTTGVDDPLQERGAEAARDVGAGTRDTTEEARRKAGDAADRAGAIAGDAAITSAVKTKLLGDPDVSGLRIDVDTRDGVVTLQGTVPTASEKERALKLARETTGVKSVRDQLKVGR